MNNNKSEIKEYTPDEWNLYTQTSGFKLREKKTFNRTKIKYKTDEWDGHDASVRRTYPKIKFKDELLNGYKQQIRELGPYYLFFTFVFSVPVCDKLALESISHLFKLVQRKLYPRKNVMNNRCFTGVCVAERHIKSLDMEGCFHFHSLINIDSSVLNHRSFEEIDDMFKRKAKSLASYTTRYSFKIALDDNAVDIKEPYSFGVETYCIKDLMEECTGFDAQIGFIDSSGVKEFNSIVDIKHH